MAEFKVRMRGGSDPHGKSRVYFTCHPEDFDKYFNEICRDIFSVKSIDCAIYYTEDMIEPLSFVNRTVDLPHVNLVIVPVTKRLLTEDNRAMREDIECAKRYKIPIMPFMMEQGLDRLYSMPRNFGNRQYINPNSADETEIKYDDKLKKYLESALLINEMLRLIRAEFTTYIFLSYRKVDRERANELMKLIHDIPVCRSLAIWYDEFITVCESFENSIDEAMDKSNVFVLLVTPHLLEDGNYVMTEEYPAAIRKGMDILPIEMEPTDREELRKKFPDIPECIDPNNGTQLYDAIIKSLPGLKFSARMPKTPEHNYLMGLAYLNGVDVEVNAERAVEFLELAAGAELFKAMLMLAKMFRDGEYVNVDYGRAVKWSERIVEYCKRVYGEREHITLTALNNLAIVYGSNGEYEKALRIDEELYSVHLDLYGESDSETVDSLFNLAIAYARIGKYSVALEMMKKAHSLYLRIYPEDHPYVLRALSKIATLYNECKNYPKAIKCAEKAYAKQIKLFGEDHPDTLGTLSAIASAYKGMEDYPRVLKLRERIYILYLSVFGEEHPKTIKSINNLARAYEVNGNKPKALELHEKAHALNERILGEEHPDALMSLANLAHIYIEFGYHQKALELNERVYNMRLKVLPEDHPDTQTSLNNLASCWLMLGDEEKALELFEKLYEIRRSLYGDDHPDTIRTKKDVDYTKYHLSMKADHKGDFLELVKKILYLYQVKYETEEKLHGPDHPETIKLLKNVADFCVKCGEQTKALELYEKLYEIQLRLNGEEHSDTVETKKIIDTLRRTIE